MLTLLEKVLFLILTLLSLGYAWITFGLAFGVIGRGKGQLPSWGEMKGRLVKALARWLSEGSIWKTRRLSTIFHVMIAWGFTFYFLVNFGDFLQGMFPITFLSEGVIGDLYRLLADLFTAAVLVGMIYFLLRRFVFSSPALHYHPNVKLVEAVQKGAIRRDSLIVGLFILAHVGSRLLGESFAVAQEGNDLFRPVSTLLAQAWVGMDAAELAFGHHLGWWLALGLVLLFIPYFPYTKHFHLIMSGANFLTKPERTSLGALAPENFSEEAGDDFGVAKLEDLPKTHLMDTYACIMCNRCQDACPAYVTGKELSPAALEVNKRYYANEHLDELSAGQPSNLNLLDFALTESALWACTACGACVDICPVGNEPMFDLLYMRRHQVLVENKFPNQLKQAFRGMERNGNPWNQRPGDRLKWADGMTVPTIEENPLPEVLWWVGCAPAYDPRAQATARAFAQVLAAAGVNYAVLGESERCTGDSARRAGNEYLFFEMAQANIEMLNEVKPKRIVTTCPHCLHTLGKEYPQFGGNYEVIHHTQLLSELVANKKISVQANGENDLITFHDPCYLGRQNGIVDAPRVVLAELTGSAQPIIEMPRHGRQSFCCGAGGSQMWKEEEHGARPVNQERFREAAATGAKTVAVGCPFCMTMMTDAATKAGGEVRVKDVVELVAERLSGAED
jgi:Fe-S oxidoreductase